MQFTASRRLREKLREAQALLGQDASDLSHVFERALDVLIAEVKKKRFGVGAKPRAASPESECKVSESRHVPVAIRRAVYRRDGGRCSFVDERGKPCGETRHLEFDHIAGFARTHHHSVDSIRLRCKAHNQHAADLMYGRALMDRARQRAPLFDVSPTRSGTSSTQLLPDST